MRLVLIAVGRARPGPERDLFDDYAGRIKAAGPSVSLGPLSLVEVESRKRLTGPELAQAEAQAILAAVPAGAGIIALDERGKHLSSPDFSAKLAALRDSGISDLAFIIGGADGLHDSVRARANLCLGLGAMTWPHMLVRPLIAEQIYRAITILSGHPYHRV
jgi:23S rRNA (pseudouridine1915-N3)-methyltransferase